MSSNAPLLPPNRRMSQNKPITIHAPGASTLSSKRPDLALDEGLHAAAENSPSTSSLGYLQRLANSGEKAQNLRALQRGADGLSANYVASPPVEYHSQKVTTVSSNALIQRMNVMQMFTSSGAATAWIVGRMGDFAATAARGARLKKYIDSFNELAELWRTYGGTLNPGFTVEAQEMLEKMLRRVVRLEQLEVWVKGGIQTVEAAAVTPAMAAALAFTAPELWLRAYTTVDQNDRMTALYQVFNGEAQQRALRAAALSGFHAELGIKDVTDLETMTLTQIKVWAVGKVNTLKLANPVASHSPQNAAEIVLLKQAVEAAAIIGVNQKFATLKAHIDDIQAAHTNGSAIPGRAATLTDFHAAHDDTVLDNRDIDAELVGVLALKQETITFVNDRFTELQRNIDETSSLIESMTGSDEKDMHEASLDPLNTFWSLHDNNLLDDRDYEPHLTVANELYLVVEAWESGSWTEIGGNAPPAPRDASIYRYGHIMARHALSSTAGGAGKFNTDDWPAVEALIDAALLAGALTGPHFNAAPNRPQGRFEITHDTGGQIGTTIARAPTTRIFVVVTRSGRTVVTAYPY